MMLSVSLHVTLLAMSSIVTESPHANPIPIQPFKDYAASLPSISSKINTPHGSNNMYMRMHSLDHPTCSNSNVDFLSNLVDQAITSATVSWNRFRNYYSRNDITTKSVKPTIDSIVVDSAAAKTTSSTIITTLLEFWSTQTTARNLFPSLRWSETLQMSPRQQQSNNKDDTKSWSVIISTFLVSTKIIDPQYREHGTTKLVDSCSLHKYDLGYPYGLFSDRFFKSSHAPICLVEIMKKNTCVSMFASPIQFFLYLFDSKDPVNDSVIPRSDLDEAIQKWLFEEQEAFKTWLYEAKIELFAILVALVQLGLFTTVLGKTIFQPSRNNIMEINHQTTAIVLWDGNKRKTAVESMPDMFSPMVPSIDVKLFFAMMEVYETVTLVSWVGIQPSMANVQNTTMLLLSWVTEEDKTTVDVEPSVETREIYEILNVATPEIETTEKEQEQKEDSVQKCLNTVVAAPVHANKEELACGQAFQNSSKPREVMSSLQANAGIYIDGVFVPYADSSHHNYSSLEDKHHLKLLLSRETKKIMDKQQGAGSTKIDVFAALYENRTIPEYDESIYTTVLDPNKLSRRQRKLAGKIALEIQDENMEKRRSVAAANMETEAVAEPEDSIDDYQ